MKNFRIPGSTPWGRGGTIVRASDVLRSAHREALKRSAVITAVAVLLCALLAAPMMARATSQPARDGTGGSDPPLTAQPHDSGSQDAIMEVDVLTDLDCVLDPVGQIEQTLDPAMRVTVKGTAWRLYALSDGLRGTAALSVRVVGGAGGWRTLAASRVLIATAPRSGPGKRTGDPATTVVDLAVRFRLGAGGTNPWAVSPGTYAGHVVLVLEGSGERATRPSTALALSEAGAASVPAATSDAAPTLDLSAPAAAAPAAIPDDPGSNPIDATLDASPTVETPVASAPATPSALSEGNAETTASLDATASPPTSDSADETEADDVQEPAPATAPADVAPTDPSIEASATIPAADFAAPSAPSSSPEVAAESEHAPSQAASVPPPVKRHPRSHAKVVVIELSKPPAENADSAIEPSSAPTDTVEPATSVDPEAP